jgi:hypothetical protein
MSQGCGIADLLASTSLMSSFRVDAFVLGGKSPTIFARDLRIILHLPSLLQCALAIVSAGPLGQGIARVP